MENHEKNTLGFLSGNLDENQVGQSHDHISSCPDCKKLFDASMKTEEWFAQMREVSAPAYLEARVRAKLRPAPFYASQWLRIVVPAGAFAAAMLGVWLWMDAAPDAQNHPIDEMIFTHTDSVTASAVTTQTGNDADEPVSFLHLEDEDDI